MAIESTLRDALDLSFVKKDENRGSAVATSESGQVYTGAQVDSDTNLLAFSPEQVALLLAVQNQDYGITEIIAMQQNPERGNLLSPITQKIIQDFTRRTGAEIAYTLLGVDGSVVFSTDRVSETSPLYKPDKSILSKVKTLLPSPSWVELGFIPTDEELKVLALEGIKRSFTVNDSSSGYGAAVQSGSSVFYSGQYSSFEGRLNVHAEMGAVIAALMNGYHNLEKLAVVSTKHTHEPCYMCGACTQFLVEVSRRYDLDPDIVSHAGETDEVDVNKLSDIAPLTWSPSV